jgi:hypothetical protein
MPVARELMLLCTMLLTAVSLHMVAVQACWETTTINITLREHTCIYLARIARACWMSKSC